MSTVWPSIISQEPATWILYWNDWLSLCTQEQQG